MDIVSSTNNEINIKYPNKWKRLISYYKPYKKVFFTDMFFAFLGAVTTLILPLIIRYVTGTLVYKPRNVMLEGVAICAVIMVSLVLIQCYSNYYIANYGHVMGAKIEYDMRNEIFGHFQKLSFSFYDNQKVGQLMSRITNDLFDITELLHHGPEEIVISTIKLVGSLIVLLIINVKLAIAAFAIIPIMVVYAYTLNRKMKRAFKNNRAKVADINAGIEDNLSGIRVVKSFANEDIEQQKFIAGNDRFLESKKDSYLYMGRYHSGLGAFVTMITVIVMVTGAILLNDGSLKTTDLLTFLLYISNFTEPVKTLINFAEQFQNGMTGYERFLDIMAIEPEIKDSENAMELDKVQGRVSFENVSFKYEADLENVLSNVNLKVDKGEYVALVGSSGAGKTTLCSLIPRFYEVSEGSIKVDDIDIRDIKLKCLRQNIGVVQQDVYLFVGSVKENIRYGKPDATDEEIIEAAKSANAHEFIMGLPDGYDTYIGQRGVKLSGGQKQRLSIARVFLKNPPILIFDEATSALDNESEKVVQESLEKLAKNRTTFVIAHRLSTIRNAKRILVLTENGIEEQGTHEELIAMNGIYKALYSIAK
ncbi:MAG: ABC transporter ATP-binding protein [Lachnospiraceae bacterium]|nr:ABC transporter ATP-binding protein [Lachnospiraceae bacterium]